MYGESIGAITFDLMALKGQYQGKGIYLVKETR